MTDPRRSENIPQLRDRDDIVLRVEHLVVNFPLGKQLVQAVSDVSFDLARGETLGLVGESGCGKTTVGRALMQLPGPSSGHVWLKDEDLASLQGEALRRTRTRLQMIFQDPVSSLNPRRTVRDIIAEGLNIWGRDDVAGRVDAVMEAVGLEPAVYADRRPHQFSGGQCQRICIARSLALEPDVLICDEPVSALDVSVQAQILNLLEDMKARYHLTMLFVAHDLAVVKNISDRLAVMYLGKLCEMGDAERIYARPAHPYTRALMAAVPKTGIGPEIGAEPEENKLEDYTLQGELPSPADPPSGCRFRTRCPQARDRCREEEPPMQMIATDHAVACHFPLLD